MLRLTALIPVALGACVASGDEGMYIVQNNASGTDGCVTSADPAQAGRSHGQINFSSLEPYYLTPLIKSRFEMSSTGGDDISRTIQLRGANVKLTVKAVSVEASDGSFRSTNPETALPPFSTLFSGALSPGGYISLGFPIIPVATLRSIGDMTGADFTLESFNAEVLAEVTVKGVINDDDIASSPFVYPITVCNRCIIYDVGLCADFTGTARAGNGCNLAQDGAVDCCEDEMGRFVCPVPMN